jgi:hypothetical protein
MISAILTEVFFVFLRPSSKTPGLAPRSDHGRFLPNRFQFIDRRYIAAAGAVAK